MVELLCIKSIYDGDYCDFSSGNNYEGEYYHDYILVTSNDGNVFQFIGRGEQYFKFIKSKEES